MNLWERVQGGLWLAANAIDISDPNVKATSGELVADVLRALLSDMERAECVEGASQTGLVLGYDTFVASPPRAGERPALLILEAK